MIASISLTAWKFGPCCSRPGAAPSASARTIKDMRLLGHWRRTAGGMAREQQLFEADTNVFMDNYHQLSC
jgi:hypothetical protein